VIVIQVHFTAQVVVGAATVEHNAHATAIPEACKSSLNLSLPSLILDTSSYRCAYATFVGGSESSTLRCVEVYNAILLHGAHNAITALSDFAISSSTKTILHI
jgi:hypothetical protein